MSDWFDNLSNHPANQPETEIDNQSIDMAVKDLELLISRVKEGNGNFPDKFHRLLEELLTIKFE
jgi:hypothetical protein